MIPDGQAHKQKEMTKLRLRLDDWLGKARLANRYRRSIAPILLLMGKPSLNRKKVGRAVE